MPEKGKMRGSVVGPGDLSFCNSSQAWGRSGPFPKKKGPGFAGLDSMLLAGLADSRTGALPARLSDAGGPGRGAQTEMG